MTKPAGTEAIRDVPCTILHPGAAVGDFLILDEPVSFWGGVSAEGTVIDRHHPQCGTSVSGRILVMTAGRGSSSSSSVLAEQIRAGTAPAAIVMAEADSILVLGAVVAAEMYGIAMPILRLALSDLAALPLNGSARIDATEPALTWPPALETLDRTTTMAVYGQ
ncbi:MAG: DUF126 domain-containing protein [Nakamurella sp.]